PCCGDACCDCGSGCGRGGLLGALEGFSLASLVGLDSPYEIGGWTNFAYYNNNIPLSVAKDDLASFDDIPDRMNLAQQWFYLGRTVDGSNGFDIGGRVDVIYGTDAQKTQAFGNPGAGTRGFGTWDASLDHGYYGWAIPPAYGEVAMGDLSVKVGHFFTLVGWEVVPATGNFFHSHSYTMFNSEPFTHTGVLATYAMSDALTMYGGWTLGWDTGFDQVNSGSSWLGGFAVNLTDNVSFTYINTYGNFGWIDEGSKNSYSHSCVLVAQLTDNLQYIGQSDMVDINNPGVVEYDTVGLNQYLIYKLSDLISVGGRMEWWKADGTSYYGATGGANVNVLSNLVFRPEYRQDWAPGVGLDTDTFAVDMIYSY
ncbi:MAG TPA: outer membrane beta-barrel protein, partial [Lacipirellulaceae bacterium]|nr:outer membrane beta-barrel protein [Lacipirellulaceae bacterium]